MRQSDAGRVAEAPASRAQLLGNADLSHRLLDDETASVENPLSCKRTVASCQVKWEMSDNFYCRRRAHM